MTTSTQLSTVRLRPVQHAGGRELAWVGATVSEVTAAADIIEGSGYPWLIEEELAVLSQRSVEDARRHIARRKNCPPREP